MAQPEVVTTPLTIREKMVIHLLIALIKIIKPFNYSHEFDNLTKEFKELMNKES